MKKETIHKAGHKPITFKKNALHEQLGVAAGKKIPAAKMAKAKSGGYGALAAKRANFAKNVLTGRKK